MRNMSFALTSDQIITGTKTVTRRLGWLNLKLGDRVRPVRKCMGLRKGEKIDVLGEPLTVICVYREHLCAITDDTEYGRMECRLEGFPEMTPEEFVAMFCKTHKCTPETKITRIEFLEPNLKQMIEKGTKAWADVPDTWLEEMRGNLE